jgi:hypothetical protein
VLIDYHAVGAGGWLPPAHKLAPSEMMNVKTLKKNELLSAACKPQRFLSRGYDA